MKASPYLNFLRAQLLYLCNLLFNGIVLKSFWFWFISPITLKSAPSVAICAGLVLTFNFIIESRPTIEIDDFLESVFANFITSCIVWTMGWTIHLFV